jgi:aryl-alcohol dehydrogenase-like predicted oxidoreductase
VDVLQWLFRTEPIDDARRFSMLHEQQIEVEEGLSELVREGIVGAVGSFPYSTAFGKELALLVPSCTGWITYLNLLERENMEELPEGKWMIGLRPFAAGRIFKCFENRPEEGDWMVSGLTSRQSVMARALAFCLQHTRAVSHIVSINNQQQAKEIKMITASLQPLSENVLESLLAAAGRFKE